jgi:hypothetical protein
MLRWLAVSFVLACGGREVSKIKYTHVQCSDCGIEPAAEQRFEPPDAERGLPKASPNEAEPTCTLVAEALVSLELGNYAEPEERAPKVAIEEKRCLSVKLSRDDRQCVIDSYDRASVAYCAPALMPKDPQPDRVSVEQCSALAQRMRTQVEQVSKSDPNNRALYERMLGAALEACRGDRWSAAMYECATHYVPLYAQNCQYVQPYGMYKKLERRLEKARKT